MTIVRIDFLGFSVQGTGYKGHQQWKAKDWPGWAVSQEGAFFMLTELSTGKTIEVPRSRCVCYREPEVKEKK